MNNENKNNNFSLRLNDFESKIDEMQILKE
jgi:hypothetical protein